MASALIFERATTLCYRLFDIAREIDLEQVRALVKANAQRLHLSRAGSEYLQLPNPPLMIQLGGARLELGDAAFDVEATARLFEHGAASIILKVPIERGTTLEALIPRADELYDSRAVDKLCTQLVSQLMNSLAPALQEPRLWSQSESYTVFFVQSFQHPVEADDILNAPHLARLLLGETGKHPLSEKEHQDALSQHFSYTTQDVAILDWNAAFVYEPSGSTDIPDLLEIANAQLLELRYFDDLLDKELAQTYAQMATQRRRWYSVFYSPYRALARRVSVSVLELSEFVERVENSLKIIGDFYLAKVYEAALYQLRVRPWQQSVTRKQGLLAQTYSLLKGEVDTDRSHLLELAIILLIVFEILMAGVSVVKN